MVRGILGIDAKRAFILVAVTVAVMFSASGLMPGEPDAQTASTNGKIAYVGFNVETEKQDIYTINPDGTGVTNLTRIYADPTWSPLSSARSDPEWSPDGARISFTALSDTRSGCSTNVYAMDADGENLERLTNTPSSSEGEDTQATWRRTGAGWRSPAPAARAYTTRKTPPATSRTTANSTA